MHEVSTAAGGFNGSWIFQDLAYFQQQTPFQLSLNAVPNTTTSIVPTVTVNVVDAGLYIQDDWRVRPNFTLSYGLRFETQNDIHDHGDFAPRLALAWGIGGGGKNAPKTVLRAGFGLFYDRFGEDDVLQATRFNGVTQLQYIAQAQAPPPRTKDDPNPPQPAIPGVTYPNIPSQSDLQSSSPTLLSDRSAAALPVHISVGGHAGAAAHESREPYSVVLEFARLRSAVYPKHQCTHPNRDFHLSDRRQ